MITNESGRSMVEMLGVLAIIGVLSVGGIAGYTMAMKKYKANELANAVSMTIIAAETAGTETTYTAKYGTFPSGLDPVTNIKVTPATSSAAMQIQIQGSTAPTDDTCAFCKTFKDSVGSSMGGQTVNITYGSTSGGHSASDSAIK
ncbi:MAG: hypothetical protein II938_00655 [Alphaproteobacteria bacterium]|nr:hypothetical protein [Alphaproteobacteria bacterium]